MATTYKTPGVYVEEITKFPPSVAQVETAIPAFIGYTEKATNKITGDLKMVPTRITSLLDYETFFGGAKEETTISVDIYDTNASGSLSRSIMVNQPSSKQPFLMYYSLQMYFANGGGPCYIVSVGRYGDDLDDDDSQVTAITNTTKLKEGLAELAKYDEPTLILFPDATQVTSITAADFYGLYNDALDQCQELQDRFTIIDTLNFDASSPTDTNISDLRDNISSDKDTIKYGAAYYPFLETILDYKYSEDDILINHYTDVPDAMDTAEGEIQDSVTAMPSLLDSVVAISDADADLTNDTLTGSLPDALLFIEKSSGFDNSGSGDFTTTKNTSFLPLLSNVIDDLAEVIAEKEAIKNAANSALASVEEDAPSVTAIGNALTAFLTPFEGANKIESVYDNLVSLYAKLNAANTNAKVKAQMKDNTTNVISELAKLFAFTPKTATFPNNTLAVSTNVFSTLTTLLSTLSSAITTAKPKDTNNGSMNGRYLKDIENLDNSTYNKILAEIANLPITLPPSGAIAGIYAKTDSNRGVWKAPANVSLNYVIKPTVKITNTIQDGLNVDTTAGKSINAIRNFTGKGNLVWGARTLAGNDNEWRYVPVRRFFNMAEESIKKATEQFVFEPNDANTWIRVRAMIENFLTLQWRAGALAGAKPEQAFYVKVGLGQTMTSLDILEGRMIVEIGMAVVRPAEFIILQFSHKMQES